jgi:hypothetical protein
MLMIGTNLTNLVTFTRNNLLKHCYLQARVLTPQAKSQDDGSVKRYPTRLHHSRAAIARLSVFVMHG